MTEIYSAIILFSGIMWGSIGIFVRGLREQTFSSVQISALRWIFSAVIVFAAVLIYDWKKLKIRLKDLWVFAFMGICSLLAMSTLYFLSMERTSVAVSDVLLYTSPIWVIIFSAIFLKEKITVKKTICILLAFMGCALVCGVFEQKDNHFNLLGVFFGICSGIAYSIYSVVGKIVLKKYDKVTLTVYNFIFAAIGACFIADMPVTVNMIIKNKASLQYIFMLAIIGTVMPFFLYTTALKYVSPPKAAVICCIEPVMATIISVFVLKERLNVTQGLGIGFIIFAIMLVQIISEKKNQ